MKLYIAHIIALIETTKIVILENLVINTQFDKIEYKFEKVPKRLVL